MENFAFFYEIIKCVSNTILNLRILIFIDYLYKNLFGQPTFWRFINLLKYN